MYLYLTSFENQIAVCNILQIYLNANRVLLHNNRNELHSLLI